MNRIRRHLADGRRKIKDLKMNENSLISNSLRKHFAMF